MPNKIKIMIIGGSGAYNFSNEAIGSFKKEVSVNTPYGKVNNIRIFQIEGITTAFLSRHGISGYSLTAPFVNYRANIWSAKELGAERILSWTGPGAINNRFKPGDLVIPDDIIDFTKTRPLTFFENSGLGFIRQNPVFCPTLQGALLKIAGKTHKRVHKKGAYVCTEGPRLETPAEIRFFKQIGADMVGMTLVPEVFLAKELEICYGTICYITNYAEGIKKMPYKKGVLFEGTLPEKEKVLVEKSHRLLPEIIKETVIKLAGAPRTCPCKDAMLRYKEKGQYK